MSEALSNFLRPVVVPAADVLSRLSFSGTASSVLTVLTTIIIYRLYLHPLAHIPGPLLARLTSLWLYREVYRGTEASTLVELHKKYGKVVRISPKEVDVDDGAALHTIYVKGGGFKKAPYYQNFDIDDFPTIFSALDNAHRATRAKAVASMFSTQAIRDGYEAITGCVDKMVNRLERDIKNANGKPIDVLNLSRSLALDVITAYLFGKPYNAVDEEELSAAEFVNTFVDIGKWFYIPSVWFRWIDVMRSNFEANWGAERYRVWKSLTKVDKYSAQLADEAIRSKDSDESDTYQARLLKAGVSRQETVAQCKDLMFAGTDSTGMNLATIIVYLSQNSEK